VYFGGFGGEFADCEGSKLGLPSVFSYLTIQSHINILIKDLASSAGSDFEQYEFLVFIEYREGGKYEFFATLISPHLIFRLF